MSPSMLNNPSLNEISRLRDELVSQNAKQMQYEDRILQASKACEAWKSEADESNRKVTFGFGIPFLIRLIDRNA